MYQNLTVLDISHNKIFSVHNVDLLKELPNLAEINLQDNPICVHKDLKDQIQRVVPFLEMFNREQLMETGQKYKEEIMKLKQQLMKSSHLGTYQGDRLIEEAENDPDIQLSLQEEPEPGQNPNASYGQSQLNQLFSMMHKSQNRTDKTIQDFEKNFGLRLMKLTVDPVPVTGGPDLEDPKVDAEVFEKGMKKQFGDLKRNFRDVVDNLRTDDYSTFVKVNEPKAKQNEQNAYKKLEEDMKRLKEQIEKANRQKQQFEQLFAGEMIASPKKRSPVKNHTDVSLQFKKSTPFQGGEYDDEIEDEEFKEDGQLDFDEIYRTSLKLHSRQGGLRSGTDQGGRILKTQQLEDDNDLIDDGDVSINLSDMKPQGISKTQAVWKGGQVMPPSMPGARASLPKSLAAQQNTASATSGRSASQYREGKDFIIKGGGQNSTTALGFGNTGSGGVLTQQQRILLGMSKPHMLVKQNELIQQMLNLKEPASQQQSEVASSEASRMKTTQSFGPSSKASIEGKLSASQQHSQTATKKRSFVGSSQNKATKAIAQSQNSDLFKLPESFAQEVKPRPSVKHSASLYQKKPAKPESDGELEDVESLLSEKKLEKRERESYKDSFLTKFFEVNDREEERRPPKAGYTPVNSTPKSKMPLSKTLQDVKAMEMAVQNAGATKPKYKVPIQKQQVTPKQFILICMIRFSRKANGVIYIYKLSISVILNFSCHLRFIK